MLMMLASWGQVVQVGPADAHDAGIEKVTSFGNVVGCRILGLGDMCFLGPCRQ